MHIGIGVNVKSNSGELNQMKKLIEEEKEAFKAHLKVIRNERKTLERKHAKEIRKHIETEEEFIDRMIVESFD